MEMASSSAPAGTSYFNFSLAQAVATISINVALVWLSAVVRSSSSNASASACPRSPATPDADAAPPGRAGATEVDLPLGVVLGVMGVAAGTSVGFDEAAALFEEDQATVEEAAAAAAFRVFDRNADGFIDAGELRSVLRSLGFAAGVAAADCQHMIDTQDEDKDGRINFDEFLGFMEKTGSS